MLVPVVDMKLTGQNIASLRARRGISVRDLQLIMICGTGMGISIVAGKVKGIRVCTCSDVYSAELSKRHNNSNVLAMGALVVGSERAKMIARHWLSAEFEGGRHQRRIDMITRIENGEDPET